MGFFLFQILLIFPEISPSLNLSGFNKRLTGQKDPNDDISQYWDAFYRIKLVSALLLVKLPVSGGVSLRKGFSEENRVQIFTIYREFVCVLDKKCVKMCRKSTPSRK